MTSSCSLEAEYWPLLSSVPLLSGTLGTRLRGSSENEATGESCREAEQLRSDIVSGTDGVIAGEARLMEGEGGAAAPGLSGFTV